MSNIDDLTHTRVFGPCSRHCDAFIISTCSYLWMLVSTKMVSSQIWDRASVVSWHLHQNMKKWIAQTILIIAMAHEPKNSVHTAAFLFHVCGTCINALCPQCVDGVPSQIGQWKETGDWRQRANDNMLKALPHWASHQLECSWTTRRETWRVELMTASAMRHQETWNMPPRKNFCKTWKPEHETNPPRDRQTTTDTRHEAVRHHTAKWLKNKLKKRDCCKILPWKACHTHRRS